MKICDKCESKEDVKNYYLAVYDPNINHVLQADLCPEHLAEAKEKLKRFKEAFEGWLEL